MKKVRIIMAILVLLGMASLAEAQIMVSSTTASTQRIYEKSGREKGWILRPEGMIGFARHCQLYNLTCSFNYQLNPYFSFGAGTGLNIYYSPSFYSFNSKENTILDDSPGGSLFSFPFFFNARVYFCDRKWSPFFNLKLGFNSSLNKCLDWEDEYCVCLPISLKGFLLDGTFGMQYKNFDFGVSERLCSFHLYNDYGYSYIDSNASRKRWLIMGYVAYNFQLKKK